VVLIPPGANTGATEEYDGQVGQQSRKFKYSKILFSRLQELKLQV
jgi:hypothetical protein